MDENRFIFNVWSERYLAKAITVKILANSLGWTANGKPTFNQRCVPACSESKKGRTTRTIPAP